MKKIALIAGMIITMAAGSAQAVFSIQWNVTRLTTDTANALANPYIVAGETLEAQLLQVVGAVDMAVGPGGATIGDDLIVDTFSFTNVGGTIPENIATFSGTWDDLAAFVPATDFYVRVFRPGPVVGGTEYVQSGAVTGLDRNRTVNPTDTPQSISFFSSFTQPNGVVVPEPSSLALLVLGSLGLMYRRNRNRS